MVMIDAFPPFQKGKYTGVGFRRLHLARPGGLRQLMNELFLWGSFDSPLPPRALAPLLLLPSPTTAPAARSWLAAAGLCHRNAHTDTHTRAPGHHGTAAAAALCPSSPLSPPRPPPFLRAPPNPFFRPLCMRSFQPRSSGSILGGPPAGSGTGLRTRAERTRGQPGFVLSLVRVPRAEKSPPRWGPPANWQRLTPATPRRHQTAT